MSVKQPARWGEKKHQSSSNIYHITLIWCHSTNFTSSSPFNLPLVSLPEFNSDRPRLTRRGLWSACGSLFTCVYESLLGIFSSKDETRPRRGRVRSETSVSNLVSKAQKSWSSRKHTMVPQNILASPLGVLPSRKLPAASCSLLQEAFSVTISVNVM